MFDVAVVNHVLEHVSDPVALLRAVRKRLRPGGRLHVAVPNANAWEAKLSGFVAYAPYHLIYFTPTTLQHVVEKAGFRTEQVITHESFSGWFLAIGRQVFRRVVDNTRTPHQTLTSESALSHVYRLAMIASGVVTYPLRIVQASVGRGDEVILIASAEQATDRP
jgi:2-polyprenyl-3-methyl-5-hydroxy-6-metoxy-1,4-benzoquinol methylase